MEEWFEFHEQQLKYASLFVAALVLFVTLYRWILLKWRADVSIRKYAYFSSFPSEIRSEKQSIHVDIPETQRINIVLIDSQGSESIIYDKEGIGELEVILDMQPYPPGSYELHMKSDGQSSVKPFEWLGVQ